MKIAFILTAVWISTPRGIVAQTAAIPPDTSATTGVRPDTASAAAAVPDSLRAPVPAGPFDVVNQRRFLRRHAFSLDHYLESEARYMLGRRGPIGNEVRLSRFGVGRGRALLFLDGVAVNDPVTGTAPFVHFPTSDLGRLVFGGGTFSRADAQNIEGALWADYQPAPLGKPTTFIELSKGTNDLRQRRARFSSVASTIGLDVGYDELLNDGYAFREDGGPLFRFGGTRSRNLMTRLRGVTEGGAAFMLSLRRFTASATGDLTNTTSETQRSGHLGVLAADLDRLSVKLYTVGNDVDRPDSSTTHQTTGAAVRFGFVDSGDRSLGVHVVFEDILADLRVAGAEASPRLRRGMASVTGAASLPLGVRARAQFGAQDYDESPWEWSAGVELSRPPSPVGGSLLARRGVRMPTLGELYLPAHPAGAGSTVVRGRSGLSAETAWELGAALTAVAGPVTNEVRVTGMHAENAIVFETLTDGGVVQRVPVNGDSEQLAVLEDRLRVDASLRGLELIVDAGVMVAGGDRDGYFSAVPDTRASGALRVGGQLFEATSSLYAGLEIVHTSERRTYAGGSADAYRVVNLSLDGRLLDANMYLTWLNITDEVYETEAGFAMTPRTFVFGINWELFQ